MLDAASLPNAEPPLFSVVIPAFNEADGLQAFHFRLATIMQTLGCWEAIYVNDGSQDTTLATLRDLRRDDPHIAIVNLSRNFGKEIAITAALDHAKGEAIVVIDADLQDPPELIPALVAARRRGFDTVYAQRHARLGDTLLKRATAALFYRLMRRVGRVELPPNTGDFRLMSRRVVDAVRQLREQHRMMKGLFAWVGFPSCAVLYDRAPRHAGRTKWTYWRLWNLAVEGITGFTVMPLKVATYVGLAVALLAVLYAVQVVVRTLLFGNPVAGYPSLMTVVLFLGGVQLMTLGVIGEYLGRVFNGTKQRPLYLIEAFEASGVTVPADDRGYANLSNPPPQHASSSASLGEPNSGDASVPVPQCPGAVSREGESGATARAKLEDGAAEGSARL
ncbi:MAG TPA: glycosyltransferase family 2 protein [Acetobacteraceae bacterium]|nr:glycosyltransferase family 2 protein [Acetobacteraceae bacterium]